MGSCECAVRYIAVCELYCYLPCTNVWSIVSLSLRGTISVLYDEGRVTNFGGLNRVVVYSWWKFIDGIL